MYSDDGAGMIVQVQCYAGRKADERPVRFRIGDRDYMVEEIVEQWYGPDRLLQGACRRRQLVLAASPHVRRHVEHRGDSETSVNRGRLWVGPPR
jgi:hypothetical protein